MKSMNDPCRGGERDDPPDADEISRRLEQAKGDVADAVNEIEHEVTIVERRGERVATMPAEAWEQVKEALAAWRKASNALLEAAKV